MSNASERPPLINLKKMKKIIISLLLSALALTIGGMAIAGLAMAMPETYPFFNGFWEWLVAILVTLAFTLVAPVTAAAPIIIAIWARDNM